MLLKSNAYLKLDPDFALARVKARDRRAERTNVRMTAALRVAGQHGWSILVEDISEDGFKASTQQKLYRGDRVWLRIPGLEPREASIMWTRADRIGCQFRQPLHPAILEMVVGRLRSAGPLHSKS